MTCARQHGTIVSFDVNYRPSLWHGLGGTSAAQRVNRDLVTLADVLFGNEEDFTTGLGFEADGVDAELTRLDLRSFVRMIERVVEAYPNLQVVAVTLRNARTATRNDWSALCWADGQVSQSRTWTDLEIFDRIGGGDAFASGFIYGLLSGRPTPTALEFGAAHGALAMTTPGDTSMASLAEVEVAMSARAARIVR
jgi:2-dehydro-3-deoxygluconokinase